MQTTKKTNWFLIIAASFAGLCLLGCITVAGLAALFPSIYQAYLQNSSLDIGDTAPDFELTALTGETIRLSQFRGQPVLLNFSASWCPSCREEAPLLEELHQEYPELVILLVDLKENQKTVQDFADEFGLTYPILLDRDGKVSDQYAIFAIPTGLFIDRDGMIQAKVVESVTPSLLAEYLPLIGIQP